MPNESFSRSADHGRVVRGDVESPATPSGKERMFRGIEDPLGRNAPRQEGHAVPREDGALLPDQAPFRRTAGVRLLVIDNGSRSIGALGRRLQELGAEIEVVSYTSLPVGVARYDGLMLSGTTVPAGSKVYEPEIEILKTIEVPVLGICGGLHLLARAAGVDIELDEATVGATSVAIDTRDPLFAGLPSTITLFQRHCYRLPRVPPGFIGIASSPRCPVEAMRHVRRPLWGLQAHPEFRRDGLEIMRNFVRIVRNRRCHVR